ncbi:alkaline phosphatase PhoX [Tropicimonas sp. IMCC6043]|uniref:alkaline phosphatase PhoX n=1 Tax=Tropicimonas sp. IMCC6043 TaxID=2510645 RepID=UPI00101D4D94|nr:alkaline phosphatase PhoX [Tropicimonas sp. IMCC6043]RYH10079.1 DUF839 domain-containing protein [Tropicimonas sp. IMCC6043]
MKTRLLTALLATTALTAPAFAEDLTRIGAVTIGGEVTGLFVKGDDLFFNVQHPSDDIGNEWAKATIGVVPNANFAADVLPLPEGDAMKMVTTSLGDYQILVQEGDFGTIGSIANAEGELFVSNDPDFNAFVPTGDDEGYLFTNWENRPGGMSRVNLIQAADGTYSVDESDAMMLDFSPVAGTWVNCFGTLSPWGNPLSSEELYFDETADWNNAEYEYISDVEGLVDYLGEYPNPYRYGYIVEITDPAGAATPVKHFAMGRFSHENSVVMPDQKTVYLSDDGTNVVFFKFVADTAGDLSAGTLSAAKVSQRDDQGFDVEWIELAHGTEADIAGWIAEYDGITMDDYKAGETSYISDEEVAAWAAGDAADDRVAFLESRKAAAAKGASAEFRKMEGVNVNFNALAAGEMYAYMAMSEVAKGMSDGEGDVQVEENKCGIVYQMPMDANYNITAMNPAVVGGPHDKNAEANSCALDNISNPDNIAVLDNGDVVIGEDTGNHENNMIWLWKPAAM